MGEVVGFPRESVSQREMETLRRLKELILDLESQHREMEKSIFRRVLRCARQEPGRLRASITPGRTLLVL